MDIECLRQLLLDRRVATMPELKEALGTEVDMTVFRNLRKLAYHSSYTHRGKYYTLEEIARFDELGLWSFRSVYFSKHGTLLRTCEILVHQAEAGYATEELENVLNVGVKDPLRKLALDGRIHREKVAGRFVHFSLDRSTRREQFRARRVFDARPSSFGAGMRVVPEELKAAIVLFFSLLDERQRRLYAGLESLKLGHGGDTRMAELLGLDPSTVAKGRRDLLTEDVERDRVRKEGGGRKPLEKKRPR
ncbi:MAG: hypothetical protein JRJ58_20205 [Deltaproteobacteria bacterium]|nr:hypothetical protein [Deltaproteobacteria bacterium]